MFARKIAVEFACGLILVYRYSLSPMFGALGFHCRFHPSCSQYAVQALRIYGFWKGSAMALRRLAKCHPFHPGGYDPV